MMYSPTYKVLFLLCIVSLVSNEPVYANNDHSGIQPTAIVAGESLEGIWTFDVSDWDGVYKKGSFFVEKTYDGYLVTIGYKHGTLSGYDVQVTGDKLSFNANLNGLERVSFVLRLDNSKLAGNVYSKEQSSVVLAKRKLPKY